MLLSIDDSMFASSLPCRTVSAEHAVQTKVCNSHGIPLLGWVCRPVNIVLAPHRSQAGRIGVIPSGSRMCFPVRTEGESAWPFRHDLFPSLMMGIPLPRKPAEAHGGWQPITMSRQASRQINCGHVRPCESPGYQRSRLQQSPLESAGRGI